MKLLKVSLIVDFVDILINKVINKTVCEIGNKVGAPAIGGRIFKEVVGELYMKIGVYGGSFDQFTGGPCGLVE